MRVGDGAPTHPIAGTLRTPTRVIARAAGSRRANAPDLVHLIRLPGAERDESVAIEDRRPLAEYGHGLPERHQIAAASFGGGQGVFGDTAGLAQFVA